MVRLEDLVANEGTLVARLVNLVVADEQVHDADLANAGTKMASIDHLLEPVDDADLAIAGMKMASLANGKECSLWIPDHNGTIIAGDMIQNSVELPTNANWFGKKMTHYMGFMGECTCAPPMWKLIHGKQHQEALGTIFSWDFENILPGHGAAKVGGGAKALCAKSCENSLGTAIQT